jgi:hypothetical protein
MELEHRYNEALLIMKDFDEACDNNALPSMLPIFYLTSSRIKDFSKMYYEPADSLQDQLTKAREEIEELKGFDDENTRLLNVIVACGHKFPETKKWLADNLLNHKKKE